MKAVVCEEPYRLTIATRPAPVRADGEALIRIRRVGLCGTDYHIFAGKHPFLEYPRVMGHELSGVVEVPGDSSLQPGQIVTMNPYLPCGGCIACRKASRIAAPPSTCWAYTPMGACASSCPCRSPRSSMPPR